MIPHTLLFCALRTARHTGKHEIFTAITFCVFFYFEIFMGGHFCRFLTHGKVCLVEGNKFCGMINLWGFGVNCETHENFFHAKISYFTVLPLSCQCQPSLPASSQDSLLVEQVLLQVLLQVLQVSTNLDSYCGKEMFSLSNTSL